MNLQEHISMDIRDLYDEGRTSEEIAKILGISLTMVEEEISNLVGSSDGDYDPWLDERDLYHDGRMVGEDEGDEYEA